jgi:hypothetical protein
VGPAGLEQGVEVREVAVHGQTRDAGLLGDGSDRGVGRPDGGVEADRGLGDALAGLVDLLGPPRHAIWP